MLEAEKKRPDAIDFVSIVTPNHLHLPVAEAALGAGFPVMSDKPATATYAEAITLERAVAKVWLAVRIDAHLCGLCAGARSARTLREPGSWERFASLLWSTCKGG
jgi:predicted dehydrogenase